MNELNSVCQQWVAYLKGGKGLSAHTLKAYQQDWNQFIFFFQNYLGNSPSFKILKSLKPSDLRAWLADRHKEGLQSRSTARSVSSIKNFFYYLRQQNLIEHHSIFDLKPPKLKKTLPRPLSVEQIDVLLNEIHQVSCEPWVGQRDRSLFMLIYSGGLRISEALSLRYQDTKSMDYLTILGKGQKFRKVPFLERVKNELEKYCNLCPYSFEDSTFLFYGLKGRRLSSVAAEYQMRRYRKLMGLPDWVTPHALRHSCATHLMENSGNLRAIQELLGHASLSTTQIYTDINQDYLFKEYSKAHPRSKI